MPQRHEQRKLLTGNAAAAWAARLAQVDYVPAFPITPQTEIIETLAAWIAAGELDGRLVTLESEHSMITAAGSAAVTGVRVFTATSSQGLLYGLEMLYAVAGWRAPFVLVNVSRGVSSPITLEPDHDDVLAARDCGFLQLHAATCQEVLDLVLIAYRVAEDRRVRLPAIVNLDGFYLSFTREPVLLPEPDKVDAFLPAFDPDALGFRAGRPLSEAVAAFGGSPYSYFRYQMHLAAANALPAFDEASCDFATSFCRRYQPADLYRTEDAEIVLVMVGSFATKAIDAVDHLRRQGVPVGLLRLRLFRPFPGEAVRSALSGKRAVAVIDQNLSVGKGGILHSEVASVLYGMAQAPKVLTSFIGGLGGRDISLEEFCEIVAATVKAEGSGRLPPPRLLFTEDELRQVRKLQAVATVDRHSVMQAEE
jgi:pyruvate ferredoxin oxidoreductase alpha subunit